MYETSNSLPLGTSILKSPSMFVIVPVDEPLIAMLTPIKDSPDSSTTLPVTLCLVVDCCALAVCLADNTR